LELATDNGYCRFGNSWSFSQKSGFHGNSDIQNSQKLDALEITAKKFMSKYASLSKIFWCKKLTHGALQKVE
jgi:hypothetical protein